MFVERLQVNKIEDDGVHLQCESLIFAVSLSHGPTIGIAFVHAFDRNGVW